MKYSVEVPSAVASKLRAQRGVYFPKSHQLKYPFRKDAAELVPTALSVLALVGGDDESE